MKNSEEQPKRYGTLCCVTSLLWAIGVVPYMMLCAMGAMGPTSPALPLFLMLGTIGGIMLIAALKLFKMINVADFGLSILICTAVLTFLLWCFQSILLVA